MIAMIAMIAAVAELCFLSDRSDVSDDMESGLWFHTDATVEIHPKPIILKCEGYRLFTESNSLLN